ncbi:UDP-glucose 4-epimerase [Symmachiella macrocystis]|uniref:UDP-glucose 4-epimerase n=1 Tax=Symmachiella macrocystis TaxID=2527985 RepID=A0A5C6BIF9_9PLAN|nr:SDR family oxidoreductase [Symmachiella macrocystis]TWU11790.1 UDP-glucose 4-epimerase [Symmachiella macrocystis]
MAKYLVTGGAGFIGSHIAERLVKRGDKVRVYDNLSTGTTENFAHLGDAVEFVEGDLQDVDKMAAAVEGIDVVFHQGALASVPRSIDRPLDTHDACVTGTVVLLDSCRKAGVRRVVYAASSSAYGDSPIMPKAEAHLPGPLSPYAAAKLAGELYCQAFANSYDLETVRIRYFNVFGPRQDPNSPYSAVIPLFVAALLRGERPTIYGDGEQSRDFTFVGNVADANLLAAEAAAEKVSGNVYNVACGGSLSVNDLLRAICDSLNKPFDPIYAPARTGDVKNSWADISAAQRDLGYNPEIDFETGLKETIDYYVSLATTANA